MRKKRGPVCRACKHRERAAIELAISRGVTLAALERRYGVSVAILYRHRDLHMPPQLKARLLAGPSIEGVDLDKLRETESQSLLANLIALRQRLFGALDVAEEYQDNYSLVRIASQLHANFEIVAKLLGDLHTGTVINNVLVMPQYVEMRVELVKALAPFPEARQAVAAVLHTIEHKAADAIKAEDRSLAR